MKGLMKFISGIFHPLLVIPYVAVLLAIYMPEAYGPFQTDVIWRIVAAFVVLTSVFPSLFVLVLWLSTPWVTDLELTNRKERILPFLVLIACYIFTAKLLVIDLSLGYIVQTLMISAIVMVAIMVLISLEFKISIHCAAIWSLAGTCFGLAWKFPLSGFFNIALIGMVCGGLIATSRLYLGYHTPREVWIGSVYGFFYSILAVALFI